MIQNVLHSRQRKQSSSAPFYFLERDASKANSTEGLATSSESPATWDSQVHMFESAWRSPGPSEALPWQSSARQRCGNGRRTQGESSKPCCKSGPGSESHFISDSVQTNHPPSCSWEEKASSNIPHSFYLVYQSYSSLVATREYW